MDLEGTCDSLVFIYELLSCIFHRSFWFSGELAERLSGAGALHQAFERTLTSVLLEQLVGVLDDFVILLQLQHALAVVQLQGDDHSTQINVVHVTWHLLHVRAQMGREEREGAMSCCAAWHLVRALQSWMWILWVLIYPRKHNRKA